MSDKRIDFKAGLAELDEIAAWFEQSEIDLTEGVAKFERGMQLVAELRGELGELENKVERIKQKFAATPTPEAAEVPDQESDEEPEEELPAASPPDLFS